MKNLASLWGNLEGMGENANQIQNCESLSLLIATDQEEFINEVVGVEVGSELCPWILGTGLLKNGDRPIMSTLSPESEASSSVEVESGEGKEVLESEDVFNALFVGKEDLFNTMQDEGNMANSLGEEKSNDNILETMMLLRLTL
ncbi:hypothetical protein V6N13_134082 [Hibiscus sabdariffa]